MSQTRRGIRTCSSPGFIEPRINAFPARVCGQTGVVLELKYAVEHDADAPGISGWFPFRLTRSSKYVIGLDAISSISPI